MSKAQEKQAVRVANVAAEIFDREVERTNPATVTELAALGTTKRPMPTAPDGFAQATQVFGGLERLWSDWLSKYEPKLIANGLLQRELAESRALVSDVRDWLDRLAQELEEKTP